MESRYLYIEWNSIPRLYNWKSFLRTLVIEKEEWDTPKQSRSTGMLLGTYSGLR